MNRSQLLQSPSNRFYNLGISFSSLTAEVLIGLSAFQVERMSGLQDELQAERRNHENTLSNAEHAYKELARLKQTETADESLPKADDSDVSSVSFDHQSLAPPCTILTIRQNLEGLPDFFSY